MEKISTVRVVLSLDHFEADNSVFQAIVLPGTERLGKHGEVRHNQVYVCLCDHDSL